MHSHVPGGGVAEPLSSEGSSPLEWAAPAGGYRETSAAEARGEWGGAGMGGGHATYASAEPPLVEAPQLHADAEPSDETRSLDQAGGTPRLRADGCRDDSPTDAAMTRRLVSAMTRRWVPRYDCDAATDSPVRTGDESRSPREQVSVTSRAWAFKSRRMSGELSAALHELAEAARPAGASPPYGIEEEEEMGEAEGGVGDGQLGFVQARACPCAPPPQCL